MITRNKKVAKVALVGILVTSQWAGPTVIKANQQDIEIINSFNNSELLRSQNLGESTLNIATQARQIEPGIAGQIIDGQHTYSYNKYGALTEYIGPGGNLVIPDGILEIANSSYIVSCDDNGCVSGNRGVFQNKNVTSITFPSTLKKIGSSAFVGNSLTSLSFPEGVVSIASSAFRANQITELVLPNSVIDIGDYAFYDNDIYSVKLSESLVEIKKSVFAKNQIASLILPETIQKIGYGAFFQNNIASIDFPNNITAIEDLSFAQNQLASINLPSELVTIGESAFSHNILTRVIFPSQLRSIGNSAFMFNKLNSVDLPFGLTSIGNEAFLYNEISNLTLPNSLLTIGYEAFSNNRIPTLQVPGSVQTIGSKAFFNNELTSLSLNEGLEYIGPFAFSDSNYGNQQKNQLASVSVPSSVNTIDSGAFMYNNIKTINFIGNAPTFSSNWLSSQNTPTTIHYLESKVGWDVPQETILNGSTGTFTMVKNYKPTITSSDLHFLTGQGDPSQLLVGVIGSDEEDGAVIVLVKEHNITFDKIGEYYVTYRTQDVNGQNVEITNTVTVLEDFVLPSILSKDTSFKAGYGYEQQLLEGVLALDFDDKGLAVTIKDHNVDFNVVGTYFVTYTVTDSGNNTVEATNAVTITPNAKPIITSKDLVFKARLATLEDLLVGVSASDEEDGDLSVSIKEHNVDFGKAGTYYVTYTAKDAFNQEVDVTNTVIIETNGMPVIGSKDVTFQAQYGDESMLLSGVSGNDYEDGTVTVTLKTHNVDFNKAGTYTVTYTTTDLDGNVVEVTNKVTIVDGGWHLKPNNKWEYFINGKRLNGWQSIGGLQYYFENQEMVSDWWLDQRTGAWYFFKGGVMQRGNLVINGKVNIFDTYGVWKGVMIPDGWQLQSNNKWKYYKNNVAVNGWQSIGGLQYLFVNQEMVNDWWLDKNTGAWYFFNGGVMQRKNLVINGKVNIFDTYGVWRGVQE